MDNERESLWDHLSHVYKKALSDIILDASIKYKDFIQTSNKPLESMDYVHSQICSKLYKNAEILRLNDLYSDEIQKYKETHSNNHNK